jgi:hypothetical protein
MARDPRAWLADIVAACDLLIWETEAFLKERQAYLAYDEQDLEQDRRDLDGLGSR